MTISLEDFVGTWSIERAIEDRKSAQTGRFVGTAVFEAAGETALSYQEVGKLQLDGGTAFTANRSYLWTFDGELVSVTFEDGRAFHDFTANGKAEGTDHLCGQDMYRVVYEFGDWPKWRTRWDVSGPRKDYTSTSTYLRA